MATGKSYSVKFRRRRSGKTNYKKRLAFMKSEKPRLVVRRSNKYLNIQLVNYDELGDRVLAQFNSVSLKKKGWKHSCVNVPAAYLSGLEIAKLATKAKVKEAIFDMGSYTPTKGCRIYAVLKGAIEGGLNIPHSEKAFPSEERLNGEHISKDISADLKKLRGSK
jgi:large subunit ribosomal protein L18